MGVAVNTDDALLTPAMWPGSCQGLGTPVSYPPFLVLNRFIEQLDISLICLRTVGYDSETEHLSWSDTMPLPWTIFPVAFSRRAMLTYVLWVYFLSF